MKLSNGITVYKIPVLNVTEEAKKKWANLAGALVSGRYAQTTGVLRKGECFCVLGVASDLVDPWGWTMDGSLENHQYVFRKSSGEDEDEWGEIFLLNESVRQAYGVIDDRGFEVLARTPDEDGEWATRMSHISYLNDQGATFEDLAKVINYAISTGYSIPVEELENEA